MPQRNRQRRERGQPSVFDPLQDQVPGSGLPRVSCAGPGPAHSGRQVPNSRILPPELSLVWGKVLGDIDCINLNAHKYLTQLPRPKGQA